VNEVDILGIDLGTTNSAIAIWEPDTGQARVLHNCEGDRITPSVVMFDPSTRQHIVGKSALSCITSHPSQVIYSVKRFIGTRLRRVINKEKTSDTLLLESLDNLELSIQDRNVTQAEELLAELKSKL
jgi:molecular chaperone DnaK